MILAIILAAIVGLSASASLGGDGWFVGVLIGLLLGVLIRAWSRINQLSARLEQLEGRSKRSEKTTTRDSLWSDDPQLEHPTTDQQPDAGTWPQPVTVNDSLSRDKTLLQAARDAEPIPTSQAELAPSKTVEAFSASEPEQSSTATVESKKPETGQPLDDILSQAINRLKALNPFVIIGVIITFIGLSLLAKYAADNALFPIELRLSLLCMAGVAMIVAGYRFRHRVMHYGLILQGGGYAAIYLTVYAAAKYYTVLPLIGALILMLAVVTLATQQAVRQNAQPLALFATLGGFLTPILMSDGSGRVAVLFAYYLILNSGILCIAWLKSWRLLNWTGFVLTFGICMTWGIQQYTPDRYLLCQIYLLTYFLLYLTVSILFAYKQPPRLKGLLDGSLTFGLPALMLTSQLTIVAHIEYGRAMSALLLGTAYLIIQRIIRIRSKNQLTTLCDAFLMIGLVITSLSVPLALSQQWTGSVWALEGLGLLWLGIKQQRLMLRLFGLLLMVIAQLISLPMIDQWAFMDRITQSVPSPGLISAILLSLAAWCAAHWLKRSSDISRPERFIQWPLLASVVFWWLCALAFELRLLTIDLYWMKWLVAVQASGAVAWMLLARRLDWTAMRVLTLVTLPVLMVAAVIDLWLSLPHSMLQHGGWLSWLLASASIVVMLRMLNAHARLGAFGRAIRVTHLFSWLFFLTVVIIGILIWVDQRMNEPELLQIIFLVALMTGSILVVILPPLSNRWPVRTHPLIYQVQAQAPVLCLLGITSMMLSVHDGQFPQLEYVLLVHPVDLAQLVGALTLIFWAHRIGIHASRVWVSILQTVFRYAGALAAFLWMNAVIARWVHHSSGVAYSEYALRESTLFLTVTSIVWTSVALLLMVLGHRKRLRAAWMSGALLLGLAIIKLFALDMANTGTLARIISFVAVGVLVLIIGYMAPLPPSARQDHDQS